MSNLKYNNYNSPTLTFATTVFSRAKGVNWLPMLISSGWIGNTGEGEPTTRLTCEKASKVGFTCEKEPESRLACEKQ